MGTFSSGDSGDQGEILDRDDLARETQRRLDFWLAQRDLDRRLLETPPSTFHDVVTAWCRVLSDADSVRTCIVFSFSGRGIRVIEPACGDMEIVASLQHRDIPEEIVAARRAGRGCMMPMSCVCGDSNDHNSMLCFAPIRSSGLINGIIALGHGDSHNELLREFTETTALRIGCYVGLLEREKGYRDMARRSAQSCASSIVAAQLQLENLAECLPKKGVGRGTVDKLRGHLAQVLDGLSRTILLGYPESGQLFDARPVDLATCVREVGWQLNSDSANEMVSEAALAALATNVHVTGSEQRLRLAVRDLSLGMWVLSRETPTYVKLEPHTDMVRLCLAGGDRSILPDDREWNSESLSAVLRDPETFIFSASPPVGSAPMAFDLPWDLIEGMGGQIVPHLKSPTKKLVLKIDLRVAS